MTFTRHCWVVTYSMTTERGEGYRESIPWNRCLGILKSLVIRAQGVRSAKPVNIFEPLHLFCQYTHLPLKKLSLSPLSSLHLIISLFSSTKKPNLPIPLHSPAMYGGEFFPLPWIGISQNSVGIFSYMEWSTTVCIKQSATISVRTDGTTC